MKKNPIGVIKTLVKEGKIDEGTAQLLQDLGTQGVRIRVALRGMLENYRHILDAIAVVRGDVDVVLDNFEDVENFAEEKE